MSTEAMIRELRRIAKKHENDTYLTFETNWHQLCVDVADRLEELYKSIECERAEQ